MGRQGQASILLIALAAIGLLIVASQYPTGFSTFSSDIFNQPESTIDQPTIFGGGSSDPGTGEGIYGDPCEINADCISGLVCVDLICVYPSGSGGVGDPCTSTADCQAGLACINGVCKIMLTVNNGAIPEIGGTVDIPIILSSAPNGLSGYQLTASLSDPSKAEIVGVIPPTWSNFGAVGSLPADSVNIQYTDLFGNVNPGAIDITLATLQIRGDAIGSTELQLSNVGVQDDDGYSIAAVVQNGIIFIGPVGTPPIASFYADTTSGLAPLTVNFYDLSTNTPTSWYWDFGDGATSTEQHPMHVYSNAGTYTVSLTTANIYGGDTETKTNYITVTQGTTGNISVQSTPSDAIVYLDGIMMGATPILMPDIPAGAHAVRIEKPGYYPWEDTVTVTAGATTVVSITLTPVPPPTGTVAVESDPTGANVYLDGESKGLTPVTITNVEPGARVVMLEKSGYNIWQEYAYVIAGATTTVIATLTPVDSDGDGVPDNIDKCPTIYGTVAEGCPYADITTVKMHIVDQQKSGICGYDRRGRPKETCEVPYEGMLIKIYDRYDPAFVAAYTSHPWKTKYDDIYNSNIGLMGSCTTDANGKCTAGEPKPGKYMILGLLYDEVNEISVYAAKKKNFMDCTRTCEDDDDDKYDSWHSSSYDVSCGGTCVIGCTNKTIVSKTLRFVKLIKKNGDVKYEAGNRLILHGSELNITAADYVVWSGTEELYPFIFSSDTNWTVDVCINVPAGYTIAGVMDIDGNILSTTECMQTIIENEERVILFALTTEAGTSALADAPDVTAAITGTPAGEAQKQTSEDIEGVTKSEAYTKPQQQTTPARTVTPTTPSLPTLTPKTIAAASNNQQVIVAVGIIALIVLLFVVLERRKIKTRGK